MRRPRPAVRALLALAAGAALAGCGIRPTGIVGAGEPPAAGAAPATITVYLVRDGRLVPVARPGLPGLPSLAVQQLAVPPTGPERAMGLRTEVRRPLDAYVVLEANNPAARRPAVVVRPADRRRPERWSRLAMGQIACTAQAVPGVERAHLWSAWEPGGAGHAVLGCDDFADLLP
ncbi:hypothetical protein E1200_06465 [Actinomadura sp. GC306]|uniref:hypothetical protein n=1 Tax=Actinomadura sp. GC306 TaxID=2530367 RepID=UPI00104866B8|nr:hypothetical protein [Actinomadura sp. GC306]TDC70028.1 hypothetical protein E1200_06465 [Actinomadura sp. GC306]